MVFVFVLVSQPPSPNALTGVRSKRGGLCSDFRAVPVYFGSPRNLLSSCGYPPSFSRPTYVWARKSVSLHIVLDESGWFSGRDRWIWIKTLRIEISHLR